MYIALILKTLTTICSFHNLLCQIQICTRSHKTSTNTIPHKHSPTTIQDGVPSSSHERGRLCVYYWQSAATEQCLSHQQPQYSRRNLKRLLTFGSDLIRHALVTSLPNDKLLHTNRDPCQQITSMHCTTTTVCCKKIFYWWYLEIPVMLTK